MSYPYNVIDLATLWSCIVLIISPNMSQSVSKAIQNQVKINSKCQMSQHQLKISQNDILSNFEQIFSGWNKTVLVYFEQFRAEFFGLE